MDGWWVVDGLWIIDAWMDVNDGCIVVSRWMVDVNDGWMVGNGWWIMGRWMDGWIICVWIDE
jgi:hypothetical protein